MTKKYIVDMPEDSVDGKLYYYKKIGAWESLRPLANAKEVVIWDIDSDAPIWINGSKRYSGETVYAVEVKP